MARAHWIRVRGEVARAYWDEEADIMWAAVVTDDDVARLVFPDELGRDLAQRIGSRVEVRGIERRDWAGRLVIEVRAWDVVHTMGTDDLHARDGEDDADPDAGEHAGDVERAHQLWVDLRRRS